MYFRVPISEDLSLHVCPCRCLNRLGGYPQGFLLERLCTELLNIATLWAEREMQMREGDSKDKGKGCLKI